MFARNYKKKISLLLSVVLSFTSISVYAAEDVPVMPEDTRPVHSVVYELEESNGSFVESERQDLTVSSDAALITPQEKEHYLTPEPMTVDISMPGETRVQYYRTPYSLEFDVKDVSGNIILPDVIEEGDEDSDKLIGWDAVNITVNDTEYHKPLKLKWGSNLSFKFETSEGYSYERLEDDDGCNIDDISSFAMPDADTKLVVVLNKTDNSSKEGDVPAPDQNSAENTVSDNDVADEADASVSENVTSSIVSDNSVSDNVVSDNSVSDNAISSNSVSADAIPADTVSDNAVSDDEVPVPDSSFPTEPSSGTVSDNEMPSVSNDNIDLSGNALPSLSGDGIIGDSHVAVSNKVISINKVVDEKTNNSYLQESKTSYTLTLVKNQKTILMDRDAWDTADKKTATVTAQGKISGKKIGTTEVYRYGALPTTFSVEVVDAKTLPKGVNGYVDGDKVKVGKGKAIQAALPDVWVSEDPKIVQVNKKTGEVRAKKSGTTTVTVTGTHNREYTVKVEDPDILVKNAKLTLSVGEVLDVSEKLLYTSLPITYQVAKPDIARVDVWGNLKALKAGNTKLYAIVNGKKYPFNIKVVNNTISGGMVNADTVYLLPKKSFALNVRFISKEPKKEVTYRIDGEGVTQETKGKNIIYADKVASVTNKGKITAIADGTTYVKVNIGGVDKYTVKVIVEGDTVSLSDNITINVGEYYYINPSISQDVIWKSSSEKVATVNEFGVIRGIQRGKAVVSGKISGKNYKIKVNVVNAGAQKQYDPGFTLKEEVIVWEDALNPRVVRYLDMSGQWKLKYIYNITYDLNGGTADNPARYTSNDDITLQAPVKENYVFVGWTGSNGDEEQMNVSISHATGHKHYVAHYRSGQFKILYDLDGGELARPNPTVYRYESEDIMLNNPEKTGYVFDGWKEVKVEDGTMTGTAVGTSLSSDMVIPNHSSGDKGFNAVWHPIHYEVAYEPNGGNLNGQEAPAGGEEAAGGPGSASENTGKMDNTDVTYDQAFDLAENEYGRAGYDFLGWSENLPTNIKKYDDKQHITSNLTTIDDDVIDMYAVWGQEVYTISYNLAGGSLEYLNPATYTYDNDSFMLNNPYRVGYRFTGWSGTGIGNETYDLSESVTVEHHSTGNRHYTAHWSPVTYQIRYDGNGGMVPGLSSNKTMSDSYVGYNVDFDLKKNEYVREGCTFRGWSDTPFGDVIYGDEAHITTNLGTGAGQIVVLYAVWGVNAYNLTIISGNSVSGNHVKSINNKSVYDFGEIVNITAIPEDGYSITGWTGDFTSDSQYIGFAMPAHDVTLTVNTEAKSYDIYLDLNGGTCLDTTISRRQGAYYSALPVPSKSGCNFLGWVKELGDTEYIKTTDIYDKSVNTIHAVWEQLANYTYTVNHYQQKLIGGINGDSYVKVDTDTFTTPKGVKVSPSVNSYEGFISPSVQTVTVDPDGTTEVNYYYKRAVKKVIVNKADNGIKSVSGADTYTYGQTVTVSAEVEDGYAFDKFDGTYVFNTKTASFTMPVTEVSLDAHSMGSVSFNANGGTVSTKKKDVRMGEAYGILPTPSREGYSFDGWFTKSVSGDEVTEDTIVSSSDPHTIYAHWTGQDTTYLVKFWTLKLDGVASAHNEDHYALHSTGQFDAKVGEYVTPELADISGFTTPNHQTVRVLPNGKTTVNFYYVRNKYTVSVRSVYGVSEVRGKGNFLYGAPVTLTAITDKSYDFDKWTGDDADELISNKDNQSVTFTMPARDVSVTPSVKKGSYLVRYWANNGTVEVSDRNYTCGSYGYIYACPFTKDGYDFKGWSTHYDSVDVKYTGNERIKDLAEKDGTFNLYAVWGAKEYEITFGYEDPTTHEHKTFTKKVKYGEKWGELPIPGSANGKVFEGWYLGGYPGGTKITPDTLVNVTDDTELAARYINESEVKIIVYHYRQKLTGRPEDTSESNYDLAETTFFPGESGETVEVTPLTYDGYERPSNQNIPVPDNTYAVVRMYYNRAQYNAVFTATDGVEIDGNPSGSYYYGSSVDIAADTLDNYDFIGWFGINGTDLNYINKTASFTMPCKDIELKATAKPIEYTLFVVKDDGTEKVTISNNSVQSIRIPFGTDVTVRSVPESGYSFKKWMTVGVPSSTEAEYSFTMPSTDVTLISSTVADPFLLKLTAKEHINSVSIYDSGMSESMMTAGSVVYVKAVPEKFYHFNGWSGTLTSMKEVFTFNMPAENVDIWCSAQENTYKVRFNKNADHPLTSTSVNGTMGMEDFICYHGKALDKCQYTREGYIFKGWALDPDATVPKFTDEQIISDTAERNLTDEGLDDSGNEPVVDLYAVWQPITYKLRFVAYDNLFDRVNNIFTDSTSAGTTSHVDNPAEMEDQIVTYDQAFSINKNDFVRDGYDFVGWSRADNIHGILYDKNVKVYNNKESLNEGLTDGNLTSTDGEVIELYSLWKPKKVNYEIDQWLQSLTFDTDGGVYGDKLATISRNAAYTDDYLTLTAPAREGATVTPATATVTERINGDGSTVFRFDYARNSYTLSVVKGTKATAVWIGGTSATSNTGVTSMSLKFGQKAMIWVSPSTGYELDSWLDETGGIAETSNGANHTMEAKNTTLTANCKAKLVKYTVTYAQENANDSNTTDKVVEKTAYADSTLSRVDAETMAGFTNTGITSKSNVYIKPDGSTNVTFTQTRNRYRLSLTYNSCIASVAGTGCSQHYANALTNYMTGAVSSYTPSNMTELYTQALNYLRTYGYSQYSSTLSSHGYSPIPSQSEYNYLRNNAMSSGSGSSSWRCTYCNCYNPPYDSYCDNCGRPRNSGSSSNIGQQCFSWFFATSSGGTDGFYGDVKFGQIITVSATAKSPSYSDWIYTDNNTRRYKNTTTYSTPDSTWSGSGVTFTSKTGGSAGFVMPASNITLTANGSSSVTQTNHQTKTGGTVTHYLVNTNSYSTVHNKQFWYAFTETPPDSSITYTIETADANINNFNIKTHDTAPTAIYGEWGYPVNARTKSITKNLKNAKGLLLGNGTNTANWGTVKVYYTEQLPETWQ